MRDFNKVGQITFGNPNHYSNTQGAVLLAELRRRAKDTDEGGRSARNALIDWEAEAASEGLTMKQFVGEGDCVIDLLSDVAPDGFDFGVRKWRDGYYNAGYYPIGKKGEFE